MDMNIHCKGRVRKVSGLFAVLALATILTACLVDRGDTTVEAPEDLGYLPERPREPAGWPSIAWPKENPYTAEKAILGRRLFFDPILSRTKDRACAWCHGPGAAFADPHGSEFSLGVGQGVTTRNSPTLTNVAFGGVFMLDGRAASLEEQALGPLFAHNEMDMTEGELLARLSADTAYLRLFQKAFGSETVTLERLSRALATYERTLVSFLSPYDRWRNGDSTALTPAARRGLDVFQNPGNACASCHRPPLFTDGNFHNIGLDSVIVDPGRSGITGIPGDAGKFKTPTLRNVSLTSRYMHDGRFIGLVDVVAHYNLGGFRHANTDARIRPLGLSDQDRKDLVAFLEALTDPTIVLMPPYIPR
jgi:cytochrome c peroxidase